MVFFLFFEAHVVSILDGTIGTNKGGSLALLEIQDRPINA